MVVGLNRFQITVVALVFSFIEPHMRTTHFLTDCHSDTDTSTCRYGYNLVSDLPEEQIAVSYTTIGGLLDTKRKEAFIKCPIPHHELSAAPLRTWLDSIGQVHVLFAVADLGEGPLGATASS
ncbi:hypothetical protein J6590_064147 [Homalodisca vitripennis]|nr:hypothetical protein J6590_064147 [Homalodisca vitripennis]